MTRFDLVRSGGARRNATSHVGLAAAAIAVALGLGLAACSSSETTSDVTVPATVSTATSSDATADDAAADDDPVDEPTAGDAADDTDAVDVVVDDAIATHGEVRTRLDEAVTDGLQPVGVGTVTARITSADGEECDVCLWLASDAAQRNTGLMAVTDIGEPVGMAFTWDAPTSGNFFMFQTPMPLSIAWFSPGGAFLNTADMAPCLTDDSSTCERYGPGGSYDIAVEMFEGELGVVGIGPGSSIELLAGTESPTCLITR